MFHGALTRCSAVAGLLAVLLTCSSVSAIPLDQFYPFGVGAGDIVLPRTDDQPSGFFTLSRVFPFYGVDNFVIVVSLSFLATYVIFIATCSIYRECAQIVTLKGRADKINSLTCLA